MLLLLTQSLIGSAASNQNDKALKKAIALSKKQYRLEQKRKILEQQNNNSSSSSSSSSSSQLSQGNDALFKAAQTNDETQAINAIFSLQANVNAQDRNKRTPLHIAAAHNALKIIEILVNNGATIHAKDNAGNTPLHKAAEKGHLNAINALLEKGADKNALNNKGQTSAVIARAKKHNIIANVLSPKRRTSSSTASAIPESKRVSLNPIIFNYTVANQQGADCGFHSVKNSTALYNYLSGNIDKQTLRKHLESSDIGAFKMQECKLFTIKQAKSRSIDTQEVYKIVDLIKFPLANISVLAELETLALPKKERIKQNKAIPLTPEEYRTLANLIIRLKQEAPVTHAFVLGTMSTAHKIKSGHFIAAALHKPKGRGQPISFHIADSIKASRDDPSYNIYLIKLLQKILQRDPNELKTAHTDNLMVEMRNNMAWQNYNAALQNMQDIILNVQSNNMMQNPYFDKDKQEIAQTLAELSKNHSIKKVAKSMLGNILNSKKTTIKTPSFSSKFISTRRMTPFLKKQSSLISSSSSSSSSKSSHTTQQQTNYTIDHLFNTLNSFNPDAQNAKAILQQNPTLANKANAGGIKPLNFIASMGPKFFNTQSQEDLHNIATMLIEDLHNIATMLIDNGADINAYDTSGKTPLMSAMETANDAMVALLLQRGADVTLKNNSGGLLINDAIEVAKKQPLDNIVGNLDIVRCHIKRAIAQWQKSKQRK